MKYIERSEFRCNLGCALKFNNMEAELIQVLDLARDITGVPFKFTSSIRCEEHNANVGVNPLVHISLDVLWILLLLIKMYE
ncbi:hypothetical protein [Photobacterium sanguinicancri]|uniref:hypothetical protein n=1 Tax=Photobacterium sanguinicancri TaxID=875932 RepID=UPI0021C34464|nr:hypothetical protein [Photobacterium sanguinicancri]